jgi:hypothetical protein
MIFVDIPLWDAAGRLGAAAALGLVVGFEREFRRKPAGLRTHMLVAVGSAAFMILTLELAAGPVLGLEGSSVDPSRIIQGIIGGIGFLDFALLLTGIVVVIVLIVGKLENGMMRSIENVTGVKRPEEGRDEPE